MKNFKFKFLSLILCICMCLTFFSGCSLFVKRDTANADEIVMEVGEKKLTRKELLDAYYSFYQQNYYYYMYYDEDTILETFYNSIVSRYLVLAEAEKMNNDPNALLKFTQKDMDKVWRDVFDYINTQVDAKEKSLLLQANGNKEDQLPKRLQEPKEEEDDEKAYKYKDYEKDPVKEYEGGTKAPEPNIDNKITEYKTTALYRYEDPESTDEEEDEDKEPVYLYITEQVEKDKRFEAFELYLGELMFSAKANGKDSNADVVFKAEVERLYKNYYESALYSEYQEFINSTVVGNASADLKNMLTDFDFSNRLSDEKIVEKYLQLFNISMENNVVENNYIEVVTSTSNTSLILYHYEGEYYYFSVQHILLQFSDETLDILKDIKGYDASKDAYFRESYEQARDVFYKKALEESDTSLTTTKRNMETGKLEKDPETDKEVKVNIHDIEEDYKTELAARLAKLREENPSATEEDEMRVRTLLFQEFVWKYTSDTSSLKTDLSGILGFTISSEPDNHGSLVKDFTNGARKLFDAYQQYQTDSENSENDIGGHIEKVVSDYGVHLMMLTGVYKFGPVIDLSKYDEQDKEERIASIANELKNTYISNLTSQTYYDYIYDTLKDSLVGNSGTYFSDFRNELVRYFTNSGKIIYHNKLSYKTLNDSVNG